VFLAQSLITGSALVILAVCFGVVVWRISARLKAQISRLEQTWSVTSQACSNGLQRIEQLERASAQSSPAALKAQVYDLVATVEMNAATTRRQFGKVFGTLGAERAQRSDEPEVDDELARLLAYQRASPPKVQ
jgi:hypothetical protein